MTSSTMPGGKAPSREKKVLLKDLNALLTCTLCNGYFIDAMTFDSCLHSFCKSCVLNHFETTKQQACPKCDKKKAFFKPDHQLQALVYKMVPGLFGRETQRREDFTRSSVRASSTCSEDSVLGDVQKDQEKWISQAVGPSGQDIYFSPEDPISLSLEFYQSHLDDTDVHENSRKLSAVFKRKVEKDGQDGKAVDSKEKIKADRRYLQCPAAVTMSHLQKFLRMKYALSLEHRVDIIYEGEVLPFGYTLMDVAYTYSWTKLKPMRFFYRIFTPLKVQPIKIINTATSNGSKHLQIVPVRANSTSSDLEAEKSKEQFVAQLKLQSKHKAQSTPTSTNQTSLGLKNPAGECVFEYEEQDEEIKRFAESRDREWARMRHEDVEAAPEVTTVERVERVEKIERVDRVADSIASSGHHVKKRKKSKHSKGDAKKPKIHAEITSEVQQESIKLKVKLTPAHQHNGHKHKHRTPVSLPPPAPAPVSQPPTTTTSVQTLVTKPPPAPHVGEAKKPEPVRKLNDICIKKADPKPQEVKDARKSVDLQKGPVKGSMTPTRAPIAQPQGQSHGQNHPSEKIVDAKKKEEQKTFLTKFPVNPGPRQHPPKVQPPPKAEKKPMITYSNHTKQNFDKKIASLQQQALNKQKMESLNQNQAAGGAKEKKVSFSLDKPHILNSQQYPSGFTVSKIEQGAKRKAEADLPGDKKRPCLEITLISPKIDGSKVQSPAPHRTGDPPKAKRPPPATIPLDRIKKSNLKMKSESSAGSGSSGGSGALDLSKKIEPAKNGITTLNGMKFPTAVTSGSTSITNSLTANLQMLSKVALQHSKQQSPPNQNASKPRPQIPNLQTLRIPHVTSSATGPAAGTQNSGVRSSAGTGGTGAASAPSQRTIPNLANLPKLNEISKSNLKMLSNHNNNLKPIARTNQNSTMIRSIPNPSLLVRQHNQSRMNLTNGQGQGQGQGNSVGNQDKSNQPPKTPPVAKTQGQGTNTTNATTQPKILNPLAKENTNSSSATPATKDSKERDAKESNHGHKEAAGISSSIQSLMNKMLDQSKGQMMVTASSSAT